MENEWTIMEMETYSISFIGTSFQNQSEAIQNKLLEEAQQLIQNQANNT